MTAEPESWEKYGFPDPTFYPPYIPFVGLIKALNERRRLAGDRPVPVPDYFSPFDGGASGRYMMLSIDDHIKDLLFQYFNPDKFESLDEYSSTGDMCWTWDELLAAAAEDEQIIHTDILDWTRLTPIMPAAWAMQRYRMINLLKFRQILATGDVVYGWNPLTSSKEKAYNDAINNTVTHNFVSPGAYIDCHSYLPWNAYGVSFSSCRSCSAVLPERITHAADAYLVGYAQSESHYVFDDLGSNIRQGWNLFKADSSGVFMNLPFPPYPAQWNTQDDYSGSWVLCGNGRSEPLYSRGYLAFADYSETFTFKEELTE